MTVVWEKAALETLFAPPRVISDRRADGTIRLRSAVPLQDYARCVGEWLEHWAVQTPDRIFLGERVGVGAPWRTVTYAGALQQVRSVASWILAQGLSEQHPLAILF
jgi:feruloyl-CoA synthase